MATAWGRDGVEMFVFVHDITARKRTEEELRRHVQEAERARGALLSVLEDRREAQDRLAESEERFRGMLEQNIAAIFMVEDGRITFANRRACRSSPVYFAGKNARINSIASASPTIRDPRHSTFISSCSTP